VRWLGLALGVLAVGVAYRAWLGERVGRLQLRVQATRAALDLQLVRRATAARDIDGDGLVARAAARALEASEADRELAESALSRAIRSGWGEPWAPGVRESIVQCTERVHLSRQFHSAAVTALIRLRRRRLVRLLRAGGAPPEGYVEIDDTLPSPEGAPPYGT
jgi:hypothetical protein